MIAKDENGQALVKSQWSIFVVGDGGFGGPRSSNKVVPLGNTPSRKPDVVETFVTSVDQVSPTAKVLPAFE